MAKQIVMAIPEADGLLSQGASCITVRVAPTIVVSLRLRMTKPIEVGILCVWSGVVILPIWGNGNIPSSLEFLSGIRDNNSWYF